MTNPEVPYHPQTSGYSHKINDPFWSPYIALVRNVVVPYQWEALNDRIEGTEPSRAIRNFKIAAGGEGEFYGMVFQDSDVAKWLEAAWYLLAAGLTKSLESSGGIVIEIMARRPAKRWLFKYVFHAERTWGGRWTNLAECHELYCAGHIIGAACRLS